MNRAASATWLGCKGTSVRAVFTGTVGLELVADGRLFFFEDVLTIAVRSFATQPGGLTLNVMRRCSVLLHAASVLATPRHFKVFCVVQYFFSRVRVAIHAVFLAHFCSDLHSNPPISEVF